VAGVGPAGRAVKVIDNLKIDVSKKC
jgi:hypothetical protein